MTKNKESILDIGEAEWFRILWGGMDSAPVFLMRRMAMFPY